MIDENEVAFTRFALERLADYMGRIATVMEKRLALEYPEKKEGKDATITHLKTPEEEILADQGYDRGELGRWLDIGTRERAFTKDAKHAGIQSDPVRKRTGETGD